VENLRKVRPSRDEFFKVEDRLPTEYDLCVLVGKNGKSVNGWRTSGRTYEGLRIKKIDEVVAWKKFREVSV